MKNSTRSLNTQQSHKKLNIDNDKSNDLKDKLTNNLMYYGNLKTTIQKKKNELRNSTSLKSLNVDILEQTLTSRQKSQSKLIPINLTLSSTRSQFNINQNNNTDNNERLPSPIKNKLNDRIIIDEDNYIDTTKFEFKDRL